MQGHHSSPSGTIVFANSKGLSVAGTMAGVLIALGTPLVLGAAAKLGLAIPGWLVTVLLLIGVIGGVLVGLTAVFFGIVIPNQVEGSCGGPQGHEETPDC